MTLESLRREADNEEYGCEAVLLKTVLTHLLGDKKKKTEPVKPQSVAPEPVRAEPKAQEEAWMDAQAWILHSWPHSQGHNAPYLVITREVAKQNS